MIHRRAIKPTKSSVESLSEELDSLNRTYTGPTPTVFYFDSFHVISSCRTSAEMLLRKLFKKYNLKPKTK